MDDQMRDEVPVPHYEDELWHALARAHAEQRQAGPPGPPPPAVAEVRARRRARRMVLAGIGSIAAAGVALAAIVVTDADESPGRDGSGTETAGGDETTTTVPEQPEVSLAAQITAATEEASETSIIHTLRDNKSTAFDGAAIGDEESWTDEQTGARRDLALDSDGEPSFDTGRATPPAVDDPGPPPLPPDAQPFDPSLPQERLRQVDYCFGEYKEYDQTAIPGAIEADRIGESLAAGDLVEDGTEVFDGRELIRLVQVPVELQAPGVGRQGRPLVVEGQPTTTTTPPATDPATGELDPDEFEYVEHIYLVDAETLRPVHVIGYPGEAPDYSDAMYVSTIEYLPRTPENMAFLSAPAPDGFALVPELRGDGERYDQCGW
jgi:hypothetical protein